MRTPRGEPDPRAGQPGTTGPHPLRRRPPRRRRGGTTWRRPMTTAWKRKLVSLLDRSILAALVIAAAALGAALTVRPARSAEIVPSIGMTRSVNGSDQTKTSYGLALRQNIAPMLTAEIGGSYRKEDLYNGTTRETQWPVTASLWLRPVSALYAGGGVGWYHTTLSYPQAPALAGSTTEKFGVHL